MAADDEWEGEFDDSAPTQQVDPIPETGAPQPTAASLDTTGKFKTLPGFEVSREVHLAQGEAAMFARLMMALKLWQMSGGAHPIVAEANVNMFRAWMAIPENAKLIDVALEG